MKKVVCHVTRKEFNINECYKADSLREHLFDFISGEYPGFDKESYLSIESLNHIRRKYLGALVQQESKEMNLIDNEVIDALTHNKILSENIEPDLEEKLTTGQRLADRIAEFGGSWKFIITFFSLLAVWMAVNIFILVNKPFDPFPFILLNLILSCLASIQAPVIMMSQNRQEQKDRSRGEHDYKINLKAELEIKLLHEKIDHLIVHQNKRLIEIQEIQTDYLEEILQETKSQGKPRSAAG